VLATACVGDVDDPPGGADAGPDDPDAMISMDPDAGEVGSLLGTYRMTYYWVADEADYAGTPDTNVYDSSCNVLTTVTSEFFDAMRLEGTARLLDERILNYWGQCGCATSPCFSDVGDEFPWGSGSMSRPLIPFRSVAVDRDLIDIGTSLYVAELDGLVMPGDPPLGGWVHDGCVVADDTGGGINDMQIDFFAALRDYYLTIVSDVGSDDVMLYDGGSLCL
jgi:3D (Asp-Asp-Asp) domain-containing protein